VEERESQAVVVVEPELVLRSVARAARGLEHREVLAREVSAGEQGQGMQAGLAEPAVRATPAEVLPRGARKTKTSWEF
jgi:hypothetical protein